MLVERRHGLSWQTQLKNVATVTQKCLILCLYLFFDLSTPKHYSVWFFQLISISSFFLIVPRRGKKLCNEKKHLFSQREAHEVRQTSIATTFSSLPGSYLSVCTYLWSWMLLQAMWDSSPDCDAPPTDCTATHRPKGLHLLLRYTRATAHCHLLCKPWERSRKENKAESWKNLFSLSCVSKDTQFVFEIKKCNCCCSL